VARIRHARSSLVVKEIMMKENSDLKLGQITSGAKPTSCSKRKEGPSFRCKILHRSQADHKVSIHAGVYIYIYIYIYVLKKKKKWDN
jgi:hypothetical protein